MGSMEDENLEREQSTVHAKAWCRRRLGSLRLDCCGRCPGAKGRVEVDKGQGGRGGKSGWTCCKQFVRSLLSHWGTWKATGSFQAEWLPYSHNRQWVAIVGARGKWGLQKVWEVVGRSEWQPRRWTPSIKMRICMHWEERSNKPFWKGVVQWSRKKKPGSWTLILDGQVWHLPGWGRPWEQISRRSKSLVKSIQNLRHYNRIFQMEWGLEWWRLRSLKTFQLSWQTGDPME